MKISLSATRNTSVGNWRFWVANSTILRKRLKRDEPGENLIIHMTTRLEVAYKYIRQRGLYFYWIYFYTFTGMLQSSRNSLIRKSPTSNTCPGLRWTISVWILSRHSFTNQADYSLDGFIYFSVNNRSATSHWLRNTNSASCFDI
jgi:hypothetical protein